MFSTTTGNTGKNLASSLTGNSNDFTSQNLLDKGSL